VTVTSSFPSVVHCFLDILKSDDKHDDEQNGSWNEGPLCSRIPIDHTEEGANAKQNKSKSPEIGPIEICVNVEHLQPVYHGVGRLSKVGICWQGWQESNPHGRSFGDYRLTIRPHPCNDACDGNLHKEHRTWRSQPRSSIFQVGAFGKPDDLFRRRLYDENPNMLDDSHRI
jgi:hypothetical protein